MCPFLFSCVLVCICWQSVSAQWRPVNVTNADELQPSPRRGHSMVTYHDDFGNDIVVIFGGRSQYFANCSYNNNWNESECGDHVHAKLIDASIVLAVSDASFPGCSLNCSGNGWCHFDETIADSYCICYDEYRGENCQYKEFQSFEYDVWYLNVSTLRWTQYDFVDRDEYAYADDWPWPTGRYEHTAIIRNDEMIIYGGYSPKCLDYCNDIWSWNFHASGHNKWSALSFANNETLPIWQHSAFLSHDTDCMYIVAGHRYHEYLIDVLRFNFSDHQWTLMNHSSNDSVLPPSRIGHAFSAHYTDSTHYPRANALNLAYIHGGYHSDYTHRNRTEFLRYLWSLQIDEDSNTVYWHNLTFNGLNETDPIDEIQTELNRWYKIPFPRMEHLMMHVPSTHHLLLFGGYSTGSWFGDTWRFDLNTRLWLKHQPPHYSNNDTVISSRSGHQWTYLPSTHSIALFGGHGNDESELGVTKHTQYFNDVWMLHLNGCRGYEQANECHKNENHGYCFLQFCVCHANYYGVGCEYNLCPASHCEFDNDTLLTLCTLCNGHGTCNDGTCQCDDGYTGEGCTQLQCANDCSEHGVCTEISAGDVQCVCDDGYEDVDCGLHSCNNNCTNRGICDHSTGVCICDTPQETGRKFSEPDCAVTVIKSNSKRHVINKCLSALLNLCTVLALFTN